MGSDKKEFAWVSGVIHVLPGFSITRSHTCLPNQVSHLKYLTLEKRGFFHTWIEQRGKETLENMERKTKTKWGDLWKTYPHPNKCTSFYRAHTRKDSRFRTLPPEEIMSFSTKISLP